MALSGGTTGTSVPASQPAQPGSSYVAALDGVRALAVLGVLAFHGGVSWLRGGFLGVDAFFVLSGFLITTLLIDEWRRSGTIRLGAFWARRARRLLPALFAVLVFVACYAAFAVPSGTYPELRADALATLLYAANWHFILNGSNYFAQTGLVSPLAHTWSLAIEEQFYLVWPIVVLLVLRTWRSLRVLWWISVAGALGSALEMALLFRSGASITRLYDGTDTHAQSVLLGTGLAVGLALLAERRQARGTEGRATRSRPPRTGIGGGTLATVAGWAGVGGCAVLWSQVHGTSPLLYQGGFLLAGLASAGVVASAVLRPMGLLGRALSASPLRALGRISYGVYLWHFPLFLWLDGQRTGLDGYALLAVRIAATVVVAGASYVALEEPVRRQRLLIGWRAWAAAPMAAGAAAVAVTLATAVPNVSAAPVARAARTSKSPPVRALVIGDSTALTLGVALAGDAATYGVTERDKAILGCGVTDGRLVAATGTVAAVARPCSTSAAPPGTPLVERTPTPYGVTAVTPDAERWTAWYRHWVSVVRPDVVVLLAGRWEVVTRTFDGHWTNILHPAFASYVRRQLLRAVQLASHGGAHVVLMTAPCYDNGEQPDGEPWPTDAPARVDAYNRLVRSVVAADPARASVFNLDGLVCPGGHFRRTLDGVPIRMPDGIHFTPSGGSVLGPAIWPAVVRAAHQAPRQSALTLHPALGCPGAASSPGISLPAVYRTVRGATMARWLGNRPTPCAIPVDPPQASPASEHSTPWQPPSAGPKGFSPTTASRELRRARRHLPSPVT